jgi:hypothetical protein
MKTTINIQVQSDSLLKVKRMENLLQNVVKKVNHDDFLLLLQKVNDNPSVAKTALKFIHLV